MWRPGYDFMELVSLSTSICVLESKLRVSGLHTWAARLTFWAFVPILNGFYGWVIPSVPPSVPMIEPRTACVLIKSSTTELHHLVAGCFFFFLIIYLAICGICVVSWHTCGCQRTTWLKVSSFPPCGYQGQTQVVRLGDICLYTMKPSHWPYRL